MSHKIKNRPGTAQEIPRTEIIDAVKSYPQARIRVKRQNERGHWLTVTTGFVMATKDLLDIDQWLDDKAGGGSYMIEATDPQDPTRAICAPFYVRLEGPAKAFRRQDEGQSDAPGTAVQMGYQPPPGPSMAGTRNPGDIGRRYMAQTPDVYAKMGWDKAEQERLELRKQQDRDRREHQQLMEKMREERELLKQQLAERDAKHAQALLEAKLEALKEQANTSPKTDWAGLATALGAVSGVVVALIDSGKTKQQETVRAQLEREGQHTQFMQALLTQRGGGLDDTLKLASTIVPALAPLAKTWLDSHSPKHTSELMTALHDQVLQQSVMAAQMAREMAEMSGDSPPWMNVVNELTAGAERMIQTLAENKETLAGQHAARAAPPRQPAPQAATQAARAEVVDGAPDDAVQAKSEQDEAAAALNSAMESVPSYMQNQEWANICFYMMRQDQSLVERLGEEIVSVAIERQDRSPEMAAMIMDPARVRDLALVHIPASDPYREAVATAYEAALAQLRRQQEHHGQEEQPRQETPSTNDNGNGSRPPGMFVGDEISKVEASWGRVH